MGLVRSSEDVMKDLSHPQLCDVMPLKLLFLGQERVFRQRNESEEC